MDTALGNSNPLNTDVVSKVSRPIFASLSFEHFRSCLSLKGYRSRSKVYCLETLNTAKIA